MAKPNIIFYFSDQQRFDTCGCYGQSLDITPHLDALSDEGVRFDLAFSPQPVCGPCRAIFQTGLYPTDTGCFRNNIALPTDVKTLANYLTEAGYENAYIGKWHLASTGGLEEKPAIDYRTIPIPKELRGGYEGFWRASDVLEFTSNGYGGYVYDENNAKCEFTGYRADCITDFALEFLDQYTGEKPFFMTVSHIEPHHQNDSNHYQGPVGSKEKFRDFPIPGDLAALEGDYLEEYPDYLGACESLDENLGRLVESLKQKGLYDNTVIIYVSDHGSHFKTRNKDGHLNGYDDYKRTCHDAALRIPLVIRGGSFLGGKVVEDLVSTASLPKTILSLAGVDVGSAMIGEDLADVVQKKDPNRVNEVFAQISESRVGRCIRTPFFKYAVYALGKNGGTDMDSDVYVDDFLYDLEKDPFELTNLIYDEAYIRDKLVLRERLLDLIAHSEHKEVRIEDDSQGKGKH
ncbi:MAG: sulfatase-like hydrolase/transferase [Sphaerochaeta sp.]